MLVIVFGDVTVHVAGDVSLTVRVISEDSLSVVSCFLCLLWIGVIEH